MNSSNFFTPSEMRSIAKKKPLQWANDFLYNRVVELAYCNKELILNALEVSGDAVLFRFNSVEWNHTLRDEKDLLKLFTADERARYRNLKFDKKIEITDKGYEHHLQYCGQKASIRSVLQHTDLLPRLNALFGPEFWVHFTMVKKSGFTFDFTTSDPHYMAMDCTISVQYKPSYFSKKDVANNLKQIEKANDYYFGYKSPYNMDYIYLIDMPLARHIKFDDEYD
jgi:hypothetical protein